MNRAQLFIEIAGPISFVAILIIAIRHRRRWAPLWFNRFWHWKIEQRWIMSRLNPRAIRPGDFYEDCSYRTMVCIKNDFGELTGISLVEGENPLPASQGGGLIRCCSAFHCGPFKIKPHDVLEHREKYLASLEEDFDGSTEKS